MYALHFFQIIVMIFALKIFKKNTSKDYHASAMSLQKTECQAFFTVVRIGYPHPLTLKGVMLLPPLGPRRETHSLDGEGAVDPVPTKDRHSGSLCIIESLRAPTPSSYQRPNSKSLTER